MQLVELFQRTTVPRRRIGSALLKKSCPMLRWSEPERGQKNKRILTGDRMEILEHFPPMRLRLSGWVADFPMRAIWRSFGEISRQASNLSRHLLRRISMRPELIHGSEPTSSTSGVARFCRMPLSLMLAFWNVPSRGAVGRSSATSIFWSVLGRRLSTPVTHPERPMRRLVFLPERA